MTNEQAMATMALMAEASIAQVRRSADLQNALGQAEATISNLRVALQNIAGMALDQFPELAKTCDRERDPYELIRQAFLKMRGRTK
jgi:hypothetical protein